MTNATPHFACGRLLRRREVWWPTWRGWLAVFIALLGGAACLFFGTYPFLAVHQPMSGGAFVVEGWVGQEAITLALTEIRQRGYSPCFSTGSVIEEDSPWAGDHTYAELGARRLREAGLSEITPIPSEYVRKDRTYRCAVDLRQWMHTHGGVPTKITLFTRAVHARRSRMLFQKAFGSEAEIGVIAIPVRAYDPQRWFTSSEGVRDVVGETIAYLYARLFFWPAQP